MNRIWNRTLSVALVSIVIPAAVAAQDAASAAAPTAPCVAVMAATVSGVEGNAADAASAVRDGVVAFLEGPALRPVALEARVRLQAVAEARQKQCEHMVTLTLTKKRGGRSSVGRVVGRAAGNAAYHLPGGGSLGTAVARGLGIGTVHALSDMASNTRAKDEMQLEWSIAPLAGGTPKTKSEKQKASNDGEDILTPLIQKCAESVVELLLTK